MTIVADSSGRLHGKFTVPPDVPVGSKLVEFSGDSTQANATFVGRGTLTIEDLQRVNTTINRRTLQWRGDPLAQSFMLAQRTQVSAVDLWFTAVGATNLLVQIRAASQGIPTPDVITEAILTPGDITIGNWTRFTFPATILDANQEYTVVIACNDADAEMAIATLGEYDVDNAQWVTAQPYQIGVLMSSSNNRTWTPHQVSDLTFRLIGADFDVSVSTSKTITLDPVAVTDADHFLVLAAVERPTGACDVIFNLTIDGTVYSVTEGQPFTLPARYTGSVAWEVVLTGTETDSPILHRDIQLVSGKRLDTSDYVSRYMDANSGTKITLYLDAILPGSSTITAYAQQGDGGAYTEMPFIEATPLGDGWYELKHELTGFAETGTRIKLVFSGSATDLPSAKNLRVAIT